MYNSVYNNNDWEKTQKGNRKKTEEFKEDYVMFQYENRRGERK